VKKYIVLLVALLAAAFLLSLVFTTSVGAAGGPYRRVVASRGLSTAIQPVKPWEEPNGVTAWSLESWPQVIYMPLAGRVSPGGWLQGVLLGETIFLHRDWGAEDEPLRLRVLWTQTIDAKDEESVVLARVSERFFALITYPPCGNITQRLVVWAAADRPYH